MEFNISHLVINIDKQSIYNIVFAGLSAFAALASLRTSKLMYKQNLYHKRWELYKKLSKEFSNQLNKHININYIKHVEDENVNKEEAIKHGGFQKLYLQFINSLSFNRFNTEILFLFGFTSNALIEYIKNKKAENSILFDVKKYETDYEVLFSLITMELFKDFFYIANNSYMSLLKFQYNKLKSLLKKSNNKL